jgi:hypothetical protein
MDMFLGSVIGNVGHEQGPVENKRDDREKVEHFVVGAMGGGLGNMLTSQIERHDLCLLIGSKQC